MNDILAFLGIVLVVGAALALWSPMPFIEWVRREIRLMRAETWQGDRLINPALGNLGDERVQRLDKKRKALGMKIVKLNAENIKKLQAVEITPDGEIVTIAGKNGQGKTSVLDSIWWALAGTAHIQAQPIRKGQTKARIRLDLGEIIVERRFTEAAARSRRERRGRALPLAAEDARRAAGRAVVRSARLLAHGAAKQFDELRRVAKLEIDIDQLDGLNRATTRSART
jgi:ABC-type sugar transport system ATPase subunit